MQKRALDITLSALGLLLLSPLMAAIALLVKLGDGGPAFYCAARIGRGGVPFGMLKFRTMVVNADRIGGPSTADHDPRLTRIGPLLRKTKLDELPQLINVLLGDMSLVGPRPEVAEYVELFSPEELSILNVRPGITDWGSLWNCDEGSVLADHNDPDRAYRELIRPTKLRLQLLYVSDHSLFVDLQILALTFLRFAGRKELPARVQGVVDGVPLRTAL